MSLDLAKLRKEVKEIMDLRGIPLADLTAQLGELVAKDSREPHGKTTLFGFLNGASSSPELVADLARWMGKSLREFETWHPAPPARPEWVPAPSLLARVQSLMKEAKVSPAIARLVVDLIEEKAREGLEKVHQRYAKG